MKEHFPHASESFRKLNPRLFGDGVRPVDAAQPEPDAAPALVREPSRGKARRRSVGGRLRVQRPICCVTFIALVRRRQDSDNAQGACKNLRDIVSRWLEIDDGDPRIEFQYAQVQTRGETGVIVRVELL